MCLKEIGPALAGWRVEIVATDLSQAVLEKSKAGIFSQFEVQRGLPIQMLVKHFTQVGELWQLNADIRAMVQHRQLNLLQDFSHLGTFDVIFCRNVLIYFDQDTKAGIFDRLAKVLEPDGVLVLGAAESVVGISDAFKPYPERRGLYRPSTSPARRGAHAAKSGRCRGALSAAAPRLQSALQDRVRQEPRRVAGDRIFVLADRQSAGRVVDQPASEHRILAGKIRQRRQGLANKTFGAIRPLLLAPASRRALTSATLAPFARIERLAHEGGAELRGVGIVLEIGRQQIGVARKHLPQQRQDALVGEDRLPRRLDPARRRFRRAARRRRRETSIPRDRA